MACGEARGLFIAIGRNGETADSMRELIRVDQESRKTLMDFAAAQPAESVWVLRTLEFRDRGHAAQRPMCLRQPKKKHLILLRLVRRKPRIAFSESCNLLSGRVFVHMWGKYRFS
jgi:hypothetical protein